MTVLINKYFIHQDVYSSTADRMVEIKDIQEFWDDPTKLIYQTTGGTYYQEHELHESREVYLVEKNRIKVGDRVWFFNFIPRPNIEPNIYCNSPKLRQAEVTNIFPNGDCTLKLYGQFRNINVLFKTKELALRSLEK